jgi:hydrogenase maturation protease
MDNEPSARRILCLGNDIAGDDGVGLAVGRALRGRRLPSGVLVELSVVLDLDLLSTVEQTQELLIVDAARGPGRPGDCLLRGLELVAGPPAPTLHAASADLSTLLALGGRLVPDRLPRRLDLLTIQVGPLDHFSETLSPQVAAAVPEAVKLILSWAT